MREKYNTTDKKDETERTLVIEGRNAVLEAVRSENPLTDCLFLTAVRTVLSGQLCGRQKNGKSF